MGGDLVLRFYNKRQNNGLLQLLFGMSLIIFLAAAINIGNYMLKSVQNTSKQDKIGDILDKIDVGSNDGQLVDRYASIRDKYPNLIGRLIISNYNGENDLTVMQTPDDPDYYLYRDAEGKYSQFGTAYLDYRCSVENLTDNFMIYAHNMKNRTQFGCLRYYKNKDYWKKYPTVTFETMYDEPVKYEIFAAFYSKIYRVGDNVFKYYKFFDAVNEAEFNDYVTNIKKMSLYDTGITPKYGEQLLTMSTCDHYVENGRFVVVARKKTGRTPGDLMSPTDEEETSTEEVETTPEPTQAPATATPTRRPTPKPTKKPTPTPTEPPTPKPTEPPEYTQEPEPTFPPDDDYGTMTMTP